MKSRIGIMGGTFDPIHVGHLILAESAFHQFGLDEVMFLPSGNPPHKRNRAGRAALEERIEMVHLAIEDNPHFSLSLAEAHELGYTYTRETLERFHREHPETEYYFIMGADSLFTFETWKDPEEIARLAVLVAAVRNRVHDTSMQMQIAHLKSIMQADIRVLDTPNMDISSRMLREWIHEGRSVKYYIPEPVVAYIKNHGLYQQKED